MNWVQARAREAISWFDAAGDDVYLNKEVPNEIIDIVADTAQKSEAGDRHHYLMVFLALDAIDKGQGSHKRIMKILKQTFPAKETVEYYRNSSKRRWNRSIQISHDYADTMSKPEAFITAAGFAYNEELIDVFEAVFDKLVLE